MLLAVVDYNYKFILVDIGAPGECSDAGVFNKSILGNSIINKKINIPNEEKLPGTEVKKFNSNEIIIANLLKFLGSFKIFIKQL